MNIVIPKPVNEVLNIINEHGYEAYIIGGAVRNWVMEQKPSNYDISTNAPLEEIKKALKDYNTFYCGENDSRLGIVNSKFPMEISRYRTKENTLESDLATRDFTMNALAYSDEDGLIDYSSGVLDIHNKVIKINGEDDSLFREDPLRILRAIRLSAEYAMRIDTDTQEYMIENKELVKNVAPERIRDELSKLLVTPRSEFYLKKYFDIFIEIIPELTLLENYNQNDPHHIYDALTHTFASMKAIEPKLELRLAMLFHDIAKPFTFSKDENGVAHYKNHAQKGAEIAREILNRLKFNKKIIQKVTKLIEYHDYNIPENEVLVRQFLSKFGKEDLEDLYKVKKANYYAKSPAYTTELSKIEEDFLRLKSATRKSSFIKKNELKITVKDLL
jgi:tRNA nucleotidyltransferase (CCA-adding enzyme)